METSGSSQYLRSLMTYPLVDFIEARISDEQSEAHKIIGYHPLQKTIADPLNIGGAKLAELCDLSEDLIDHDEAVCRCNGNNLRYTRNGSSLGFYNPERCSLLLAVACQWSDHKDFEKEWDIYGEWFPTEP